MTTIRLTEKIGGRNQLLHKIIEIGLQELLMIEATLYQRSPEGEPNQGHQAYSDAAALSHSAGA